MATLTNNSFPNASEIPSLPHAMKPPSALLDGVLDTPSDPTLQQLLRCCHSETVEIEFREGLKLLAQLEDTLAANVTKHPAVRAWAMQIEDIKQESVESPTIIGVMGSTGAGKSSIINAILDEEAIVPTNCMRACTAVVTEISYNHDEVPYRAEIEFVPYSEWEAELNILLGDLIDDAGQFRKDYIDETSLAGTAHSKIRAIYPEKRRDEITYGNIGTMLDEVAHLLGETHQLSETDPRAFHAGIQRFVDSKYKGIGGIAPATSELPARDYERELWPLIKVVRLYVKSPALSTGATLVDLPGLGDSNAGRSAVARQYIKRATSIWIVAPIIRAVDDETAKSLLGESFKRQLIMDGGVKSITFICSKTDDINITEMQRLPQVAMSLQHLRDENTNLDIKERALANDMKQVKKSEQLYKETIDYIGVLLGTWTGYERDLNAGRQLSIPPTIDQQLPRKRRRRTTQIWADAAIDHTTSYGKENAPAHGERRGCPQGQLLTIQHVRAEIDRFRVEESQALERRMDLRTRMKNLRQERSQAVKNMEENKTIMHSECIGWRNEYSTRDIQNQFIAGVQEFDEDLAADRLETDAKDLDYIRDYDQLRRSLPVFCVSASAYQKLQGRLRNDAAIAGFQNLDQTQVPTLRQHCIKLAEGPRVATYRKFLNRLHQFIFSLAVGLSRDSVVPNNTRMRRPTEVSHLQRDMERLVLDVTDKVQDCGEKIEKVISNNILNRHGAASASAANQAVSTIGQWAQPIEKGGYHYSVYKAICRRNGAYENKSGKHDWNDALFVQPLSKPILRGFAPNWEHVFMDRIPEELDSLYHIMERLLNDFHEAQVDHYCTTLARLQPQIAAYLATVKDALATFRESIHADQKDISRQSVTDVGVAMSTTYKACNEQHGELSGLGFLHNFLWLTPTGLNTFRRMKEIMSRNVTDPKNSMFTENADHVRAGFQQSVSKNLETLNKKLVTDVLPRLHGDYNAVLSGHMELGVEKPQQALADEIMGILYKYNIIFKDVLGCEEAVDSKEGVDTSDAVDLNDWRETDDQTAGNEVPEWSGYVSDNTEGMLSSVESSDLSDLSDLTHVSDSDDNEL
ncbi:MAG: hypothetical protein Q9218_004614 [Villophora microphyllina]